MYSTKVTTQNKKYEKVLTYSKYIIHTFKSVLRSETSAKVNVDISVTMFLIFSEYNLGSPSFLGSGIGSSRVAASLHLLQEI